MRLVSLTGAESVTHPEFGEATVGDDGVFDVPEHFGRALIALSASWRDEVTHVAELARRERAELQDPRKALDVLATLRSHVAELREKLAASTDEATAARISELEQQVTDLRAQLDAAQSDHDGGEEGDSSDDDNPDEGAGDDSAAATDESSAEPAVEMALAEPVKKATVKKTAAKKATTSK